MQDNNKEKNIQIVNYFSLSIHIISMWLWQ